MLNIDMKRKINTLRDILVGKIPDPKTQVEQITLAMIFKFMDDIDTEFSDWGGERSFFIKSDKMDYSKYAWSNLMQPQVSGEERSNLYREGIENMAMNPHIPQLFRDIFRNAYLPFRDPETINMFLKEIDDFKYDNSEDLGNAFEMLLSIMGSQGDAGQFRTPRHIIDMIVEIVDPSKTDTILDPACGTAGFLISAYKYILSENTDENGNVALTPDERSKLTNSIVGYDISPDMVRLSNVNLYLHHFPEPHIHVYDTLTSQNRWDDNFDVILANPPFMTPKGGINPHNRFRVQARRSEVLFVDYIAEHLNPGGKAGIIVPEGIVFQTSNAYKDLRKMLVDDNYLYAVISLPAGVFNPYSGVKTSILLFDRTLAAMTDNILFVKIENDGYDLGAQRREVGGSNIPWAIDLIKKYQCGIAYNENLELAKEECNNAVLARKDKIAVKDYVLVGERYRTVQLKSNTMWKTVRIDDICDVSRGASPRPIKKYITESADGVNWIKIGDGREGSYYINNSKEKISMEGASKSKYVQKGDLILSNSMSYGKPYIMGVDGCVHDGWLILKDKDNNYNKLFLCYVLASQEMKKQYRQLAVGGVVKNLNSTLVKGCVVPLPPLSIQHEIVEELESYQKVIDGARMVVENYKPVVEIKPEWALVEVGSVCEFNPKKSEIRQLDENTKVSFVPMDAINENQMFFDTNEERTVSQVYSGYTYFREDDVILAKVTPCFENGKSGIAKGLKNGIGFGSSEFYIYRAKGNILPEWVYIFISSRAFKIEGERHLVGTGGLKRVDKSFASSYRIPVPSLEIQKRYVDNIYKEMDIVESNKALIGIYEQKIQDKIAEVWGE